jgi:hypothetical protein
LLTVWLLGIRERRKELGLPDNWDIVEGWLYSNTSPPYPKEPKKELFV